MTVEEMAGHLRSIVTSLEEVSSFDATVVLANCFGNLLRGAPAAERPAMKDLFMGLTNAVVATVVDDLPQLEERRVN